MLLVMVALALFSFSADAATSAPKKVGRGLGDPLLVGFDGRQYKVDGLPGKIYNWYSDIDIQVNVQIQRPHNLSAGDYITEVGIRLGTRQQVYISTWPTYKLSMSIGRRKGKSTDRHWDAGCGIVSTIRRDTVLVKWQQYTLYVTRREHLYNGKPMFWFINLSMDISAPRTNLVNGIIGRTWVPNYIPITEPSQLTKFEVKGDIFSRDYLYSVFKRTVGLWDLSVCAKHQKELGSLVSASST